MTKIIKVERVAIEGMDANRINRESMLLNLADVGRVHDASLWLRNLIGMPELLEVHYVSGDSDYIMADLSEFTTE